MEVSGTTDNKRMEDTLRVLQPASIVMMDMTTVEQLPRFASNQEIGKYMDQIQHATKVMLHIPVFT